MSNHTYTCKHCPHTTTQAHYMRHFLENHKEKLDRITLKGGSKGRPVSFQLISGSAKDNVIPVFACLGCKKFWARQSLADKHMTECENKSQHSKLCDELLTSCGVSETAGADLTEVLKPLQTTIKKQEREIKNLESELEDCKENSALYKRLIWGLVNTLDKSDRRRLAQTLYELPDHPSLGEIDWEGQLLTEYEVGSNNFQFPPPDETDD